MSNLNLYLLSQSVNNAYDTYDSCVVAAKDEDDAKSIHPDGDKNPYLASWAPISDVSVKLIGVAVEGVKRGRICTSFNAG